jgi:hypothetical protein
MCLLTTVVASRLASNYFDDSNLELEQLPAMLQVAWPMRKSSPKSAGFHFTCKAQRCETIRD